MATTKKITKTTKTTKTTGLKPKTASCTGTCTTVKADKPANHNKRWTQIDEQQLILGYAGGSSPEFIAKQLERTTVAVLGRLAEFGLVKYNASEDAYFTVPTKLYQF